MVSSTPDSPTAIPSPSEAVKAANNALDELTTAAASGDGEPNAFSVKMNGSNGINHHEEGDDEEAEEGMDKVAQLQAELARTREERETYANQYKTLLSRLGTMRSTLGDKLKQDAVRKGTTIFQ